MSRLLLKNGLLYTPEGVVSGYLAVEGRAITYVGAARPAGDFDREKNLSGKLVLPGLVNGHTHTAMTLLRGVGSDLPLQSWLFDRVFPVEARLTAEDIAAGTALALLEMIGCGTTSFTDMYFHPQVAAELVAKSGMKANLCYPVQAFDPGETYEKNPSAQALEALWRDCHGMAEGRVLVDGCLHAEYTCNDDVAAGVAAFAKEKGLHMHVHLSETDSEHRQCLARHGCTPAAWMESRGVFDVPCSAAHCVWVTPEDRAIFRRRGVTVIHNPSSNMKLGSGFAPVPELLAEGVNVALGTDGAASNNNLDMLEELHLAAILHKGRRHAAAAVPCAAAIAMATRGGAVAQGRADCGILAPGMRADLMAIDLDRPHLTPCLDAAALVTYSAQSADVCLTMADGEILYENGDYLTLDREKILFEARAAARRIYG